MAARATHLMAAFVPRAIRSLLRVLYPLVIALLAAVVVFPLLYKYDNKYTHAAAQPIGGILFLNDAELAARPLRYLVREWEYYPGALLAPEDFKTAGAPLPERYMSIGQYGGFEAGNRAPHGAATYRLTILLPDAARDYSLLMPEVYSAYRLYVDGKLTGEMGNPDAASFQAGIGARLYTFSAAGRVEIIAAAADYGSFYSGMTHPPAFGEPHAILGAWNASLITRAVVCAVAIFSYAIFLYASLRARYRMGIPFALLCMCFAAVCAPPLIRLFYFGASQTLQGLRNLCYYAMFPLILVLFADVLGLNGRLRRALLIGSWLFCAAVAVPVSLPPAALQSMRLVTVLSDAYKLSMTAALLIGAGYAARRQLNMSAPLLGAVGFFILSLAFDRLYPLYEPIRSGWFPEIGGAALLILLGGQLGGDIARVALRETALAEELRQEKRMLAMQREHYEMLDRQIADTRALRHDMRQQMLLLSAYAEKGDLQGMRAFLKDYSDEAAFQEPLQFCANHTINVLVRYYAFMARRDGVEFTASLRVPEKIPVPEMDIAIVLGNILENALEACRAQSSDQARFIRVMGETGGGRLLLAVDNSFDGRLRRAGDLLLTTKPGHSGQGTRSVREAALRNAGMADFSVQGNVFQASAAMKFSECGRS